MNKIIAFTFFIGIIHIACKNNKAAGPDSVLNKKQGLEIDSSIKAVVLKGKKNDDPGKDFSFAKLDVKVYENGKPVNRILFTGDNMPYYAMYLYAHDTLRILFTHIMGASFGFAIEKYNGSCRVSHIFSHREDTAGTYKLTGDPTYKSGLMVPCKYHVILNKRQYENNEPVYGYVEAVSEDFLIKTDTGNIRSRTEFKGYFKTGRVR